MTPETDTGTASPAAISEDGNNDDDGNGRNTVSSRPRPMSKTPSRRQSRRQESWQHFSATKGRRGAGGAGAGEPSSYPVEEGEQQQQQQQQQEQDNNDIRFLKRRERMRSSREVVSSKSVHGDSPPAQGRRRSSSSRQSFTDKQQLLQEMTHQQKDPSHGGQRGVQESRFVRSRREGDGDTDGGEEPSEEVVEKDLFENEPIVSVPFGGRNSNGDAPSFPSSLHGVTGSAPEEEDEVTGVVEAETSPWQPEENNDANGDSFITAVVVENPIAVEPFAIQVDMEQSLSEQEELDTTTTREKSSFSRQKRNLAFLVLALAIVVLLVAVILVATRGVRGGGGGDGRDSSSTNGPFDVPTTTTTTSTSSPSLSVATTLTPSPSPTANRPSMAPASIAQVKLETLVTMVGNAMTRLWPEAGEQTFRDLRSTNTSQGKAAQWMVSQDELFQDDLDWFLERPDKLAQNNLENDNDFLRRQVLLERFAVVVLALQSSDANKLLDKIRPTRETCQVAFLNSYKLNDEIASCLQRIAVQPRSRTLSGTLPPEIALIGSLLEIELNSHQFTGSLPQVWGYGLTKLTTVKANFNTITGSIPSSWARLSYLETVSLTHNKINFWRLQPPETIDNNSDTAWWPQLHAVDLSHNKLEGNDLLHDMTRLLPSTSLTELKVEFNNLSGTIPSLLGDNLPSLRWLNLGNNNLQGTVPPSLLSSSVTVDLDNNNLTGPVLPYEIGGATVDIDLHGNDLTGTIPSSIWSSLSNLDLSQNRVSGTLPAPSTDVLPIFIWLHLARNSLTGTLPPLLPLSAKPRGETTVSMDLSYNRFTGTIPSNLFSQQDAAVDKIMLQGNQLSGTLPQEILNLPQLETLRIENNNIQGNISFLCFHDNAPLKIWADCEGPDAPVVCDCCKNC